MVISAGQALPNNEVLFIWSFCQHMLIPHHTGCSCFLQHALNVPRDEGSTTFTKKSFTQPGRFGPWGGFFYCVWFQWEPRRCRSVIDYCLYCGSTYRHPLKLQTCSEVLPSPNSCRKDSSAKLRHRERNWFPTPKQWHVNAVRSGDKLL